MSIGEKVVYILGTARSGTTLLDVILGNAETTFSCGEVIKFPLLQAVPHGFDEGTDNYAFWKRVEQRYFDIGGLPHGDALQLSCDIESHSRFLRTIRGIASPKRKQYASYIKALFTAIHQESGAQTLIDSSKYPARALALHEILGERVSFIYLTRSRKDIVRSFAKKNVEQPSKGWVNANLYYFVITAFCKMAVAKIGKGNVVCCTLDAFQNDPAALLTRIEETTGVSMAHPKELLEKGKQFEVGHLFEGNRIRLQQYVRLNRT